MSRIAMTMLLRLGLRRTHRRLDEFRQAHDSLEHLLLEVLLSSLQVLEREVGTVQCSLPLLMQLLLKKLHMAVLLHLVCSQLCNLG